MPFDSIEAMVVATCEAVRPPERLTVSKAAEKYRYLKNPGSYIGPWDNSIAPYLVEPMDELTSLEQTGMIFVGPARTGKSDMFFNWLTHTAKCDPADMMVVHMTQNTARDWSQGDLGKNLRNTDVLAEALTPGRQNRNVHDLKFLAGTRLLIKWPTITELSGKTIPRVWLMDYDRMPLDIDKEGAPYPLAKKRTQTFGRFGMTVAESSPGHLVENPNWIPSTLHEAPPTQGILSLYNSGDRRRWYWKCPKCRGKFEGDFKHLKYPNSQDKVEAAEAAVLECPLCAFQMTHDFKHDLNLGGRWIKDGMTWSRDDRVTGRPIRSDIASFWLKGVSAAFMDWKMLVLNYLKAVETYETTGGEEALKTTVTTDQGLPYTPKATLSARLPEELKERAEDWGGSKENPVIPEGVRYLIASIDVQARAFVVQVHGYGPGGDIWIVDMFKIQKAARIDASGEHCQLDPAAYPEDWQVLVDQVIERTYPLGDFSGRHMQIKMICCDSGGEAGVTTNAYKFYWWLQRDHEAGHHKRFQLVKGVSTPSAPRYAVRTPDSKRKDSTPAPVGFIHSNMMKDVVFGKLGRTDPDGGMIHFPKWADDWLYRQLTAEVRTAKGWENPRRKRNEAWDLLYYAEALGLDPRVRAEHIDWEQPPKWASEWDANSLVFEESKGAPFAEPKKRRSLAELAKELA